MTKEQKADALEDLIACLDTLYEEGQDCVPPIDTDSWVLDKFGLKIGELVPDPRYDALRVELKSLRPKSKVFKDTTASNYSSAVKKVKHDPPMSSIEKASHEVLEKKEEMLFKWLGDCVTNLDAKDRVFTIPEKKYQGNVVEYPRETFYQQYKLDGVALALYYENGELVSAGLRPRNGVDGEDVTEQVQYVSGIEKTLPLPVTGSIRGELICKLSDFDKVQKELEEAGEQLRANPRNHAAGAIRNFKEPAKVAKMRLSFIAYTIENFHLKNQSPFKTEIERAKWVNQNLGITFVRTEPFNFYQLKKMEENVPNLDYEVDGIVVGVDNLEDQEQLGRHGDKPTGNPRGKIAWKFAEEEGHPEIKELEWNTGRTGVIKPVACFDPVRLAGTNVSRATLHNVGFMFKDNIGVGTTITVVKAGKIIPKVIGVVSGQVDEVEYPSVCPSCGAKTQLNHTPSKGKAEETYELVCPNKNGCPAQNLAKMTHFLTTLGCLGLGEARVEQLIQGGKLKTFADFFELTTSYMVSCGLSNRQAQLALATIHMVSGADKIKENQLDGILNKAMKAKKQVPLWQVFAALGIPSAGKNAGKALAEQFGSLEKIVAASDNELLKIDAIGEKTAKVIVEYFNQHGQDVLRLLNYIEPQVPKVGKLTGKKFCFSGGFAEGKKFWEEKVENQGGKCSSSVSKTTSYLIAGDGSGAKSNKAKDLGVPILTVEDLHDLLGE
jgi:DNA ligase (NAD+)